MLAQLRVNHSKQKFPHFPIFFRYEIRVQGGISATMTLRKTYTPFALGRDFLSEWERHCKHQNQVPSQNSRLSYIS